MRGHRPSSSLTGLMFEHEDQPQPEIVSNKSTESATIQKSWSALLPAFLAKKQQQPPPRRLPSTVSLCVFVSSLLCFCILALALGLGLGLGLRPWYRGTDIVYAPPPFNYSSYYGIPANLETVPAAQLVNATELELNTGFTMRRAAGPEPPTVRAYEFDITQALAAPDGFRKPMVLVNGQSPGPLIEANTGDAVRVRVNNRMASGGGSSSSSVTIHWHGIDQHNTTWMDGVAAVSQCGIPPGRSFTYEFRVGDQRGTFWWHAHLSVQYSDGVYGPIVIHDPEEMVPETDDEKIIFVSDVYHTYGSVLLDSYLNTTSKWVPFESGVEPLPDNLLLNGQNTYDCSIASTTYPPPPASEIEEEQGFEPSCTGGQLYTTKVELSSTVRLRLINASSFLPYWISVDNHTLTVVELDGVEVEPFAYAPNGGVYLNVGQRVSVLLAANQTAGNYAIRATIPRTCFVPYAPYISAGLSGGGGGVGSKGGKGEAGEEAEEGSSQSRAYEVHGILSYDDVDPATEPVGRPGNTSNPYGVENNGARGDVWEGCDDVPFDVPRPMRREPAVEVSEANMHYIEYMFRQAQDVNRIFINKTAYSPLPNNATLWKAVEQSFDADVAGSYNSWDFGLNQQVLLVPDADKGVQIVINSQDAMEHPWHLQRKHSGHTFQVVGWGPGLFGSGDSATTWNLENPMRRDTVTVPALSHVVIRFAADNPGLWALHCHVAWHMEGGMFLSIAERPDDLVELVNKMDPETRRLSQSFCGTESNSEASGDDSDDNLPTK